MPTNSAIQAYIQSKFANKTIMKINETGRYKEVEGSHPPFCSSSSVCSWTNICQTGWSSRAMYNPVATELSVFFYPVTGPVDLRLVHQDAGRIPPQFCVSRPVRPGRSCPATLLLEGENLFSKSGVSFKHFRARHEIHANSLHCASERDWRWRS